MSCVLRNIFTALLLATTLAAEGQYRQHTWFFGQQNGIDFTCQPPRIFNSGYQFLSPPHTSIASKCGDMEVFSDGNTIRLGSGITVMNATSLSGDNSNWQGNLMIERADSPSVKYLFTSGHFGLSPSLGIRYTKFYTSPAPAAVLERDVQIFNFTSSQITAVRHANGRDWWVIFKKDNDSSFYSLLISDAGIDMSNIIESRVGPASTKGDFKVSPCGSYLAIRDPLHLYTFNAKTGELKKYMDFFVPGNPFPTGNSLEFSQGCNSLFVGTEFDGLYYFNLDVPDPDSLRKTKFQVTNQNIRGGMQLGPDGIIYIIRDSSQTSLAALVNGNMGGAGSGYVTFYINLERKVGWKFPNVPGQELNIPKMTLQNTCEWSTSQMGWDPPLADSVVWNFGDTASGTNNRDTGNVVQHVFSHSGCFYVSSIAYKNGGIVDSASRMARINPIPKFNIGNKDTGFCSGGILVLNATTGDATSYLWQNGSTNSFQNVSTPGQYWVRVAINCCVRTDTVNVYIDTMTASFGVYPRVQCLGGNAYEFENSSISPAPFTSVWDYGDGNIDTAFEPIHTYTKRDVFTVTLTTISKNGCRSRRSLMTMTVEDPKARIWTDNPIQCFAGNEFIFNDSTTLRTGNGIITSRFFDFGDGDTSSKASNKKIYQKPGAYTVKLIAESSIGCRDTMRLPVIVQQAKAALLMDTIATCERENLVRFTDSSFGIPSPIQSRIINLGDGNTFSGTDTLHRYARFGTYRASIRVETGQGCADSLEIPLTVHPSPDAGFLIDKSSACLYDASFEFTNQMKVDSGALPISIWSMGDGTSINPDTTSGSSFIHTYRQFGNYDIRQKVVTDYGCTDSIQKSVAVYDVPVAKFEVNDDVQCFNGHLFEFRAVVDTINPSPVSLYRWDLGDNTRPSGILVSHIYQQFGTYPILHWAENDKGCKDSAFASITLHPNPKLTTSLSDSALCFDGHNIDFNAVVTIADNSPVEILWDFGDNTQSTSFSGRKRYATYGNYAISSIATSANGCKDSTSASVELWPDPTVRLEINDTIQCFTGHAFNFSGSRSSVAGGSITEHNWQFSDGTSAGTADVSSKQFAENKFYNATLRVTTDKGCEAEQQRSFGFYPFPELKISTNENEQCLRENQFVFNARGSSVDIGFLRDYRWNFGDGTTGAGITSPVKIYQSKGEYKVVLQTVNNEGCEDSTSTMVRVNPNPVADFDVDETCLRQPSSFRDLSNISEGTLQSWIWELGDASVSVQQNPQHYYKKEGEYNVGLRVVSSKNCQDEVRKNAVAKVKSLPYAEFTTERIASDERSSTYQFTDKSKSPISWLWLFGNGSISTIRNPQETFNDTATLNTTLIVVNDKGCSDTLTRSIFVYPEYFLHIPNAFTPNSDSRNATFGPEGSPFFRKYNMQIFSRWGELIFESNRFDLRWDGTYKGQAVQEGVYNYIILLTDLDNNIRQFAGGVLLFR